MRLFVYKTLFIFICLVVAYKLTLGSFLGNLDKKINQISSKENQILIKEKIRKEIKNAVEKDEILEKEDAILMKKFIEKINKEILNAN